MAKLCAPAVQDASWLSYSCRTVILRGGGGGGGVGGGGGGNEGDEDGVWEEWGWGVVGCPGYVELGDGGQGVGEGECGDKEEVRDGRGGEGE